MASKARIAGWAFSENAQPAMRARDSASDATVATRSRWHRPSTNLNHVGYKRVRHNGLALHGSLLLCSGRGIGCVSLRRADWIAFHEYSTCCRHNQGFRVLRFSPLSVRARRNTRLCSRGHGLFRIQLAVRGPRLALRGGSASLKMANPLSTTKVQINPKS